MKKPPLSMFSTENFKAIQKSGRINFGWLTCFIGNNGVGKSSLIEALETFRDVVLLGLDPALRRWRGLDHVWNKARERKLCHLDSSRPSLNHELKFQFDWKWNGKHFRGDQSISQGSGGNSMFIETEHLTYKRPDRTEVWSRTEPGKVSCTGDEGKGTKATTFKQPAPGDGESMLKSLAWDWMPFWQFLMLNPERMGQPTPQQLASHRVTLARDGSNIAEYLNEIRELDANAFAGILEALRFVLPYAKDLQPALTSELERAFYLRLNENNYQVPGWLLSTGTLRIVAILACLRHPKPPPLLVIEEIENGLDPRTLHLVVEEIRAAITAGTTQVILTTHSPYLVDLLDLSHIVVVEREEGQPVFRRPDAEQLADWSKSFSPGRLYTMGRLTRGDQ